MKKVFFIIAMFCLFLPCLHGQDNPQLIDSIVSYYYQDFVKHKGSKSDFKYDQNDKLIYDGFSGYFNTGDSLGDYKGYEYDSKGRLNKKWRHKIGMGGQQFPFEMYQYDYSWEGDTSMIYSFYKINLEDEWTQWLRSELNYARPGIVKQKIDFMYKNENWGPWRYTDFSFNNQDLETQQLLKAWDKDSLQWKNSFKTEKAYNSDGNLLIQSDFRWNVDSTKWIKIGDIITREYDSLGRLSKEWYPIASDEGGRGFNEYQYDSSGNFTLVSMGRFWWPYDTGWINLSKTYREFDSNNQIIKEERYQGQALEWIPEGKNEICYNLDGYIQSIQNYSWSLDAGSWIQSSSTNYEYNDCGNLSLITRTSADSGLVNYYSQYYYHNSATRIQEFTQENILTFPNPSDGIVNFSGLTRPATVKLYNNYGQLLKIYQYVINSIDISPFSSGILHITIETGSSTLVKTIIKN